MTYEPGDYVEPTDIPSPPTCRVVAASAVYVGGRRGQLLRLQPVTGMRPLATLVRIDTLVRPVAARQTVRSALDGRRGPKLLVLPRVVRTDHDGDVDAIGA